MKIDITHPFFIVHQEFLKFAEILFKKSSFGYFDYERYYYDGYTVGLHQIPEFSHQAVQTGLITLDEIHQVNQHYLVLTSDLPVPDQFIQENMFLKNINV